LVNPFHSATSIVSAALAYLECRWWPRSTASSVSISPRA
jgi:hypothetical protein